VSVLNRTFGCVRYVWNRTLAWRHARYHGASSAFLDRWAAGEVGWNDGRARGEVIVEGPPAAWPRWLAATGYLLQVEPDTTQEGVMEEGRHGCAFAGGRP
jgi:hypothetical protein